LDKEEEVGKKEWGRRNGDTKKWSGKEKEGGGRDREM